MLDGSIDKNGDVIGHELAPGVACPTCERRIPHPRKESSPQSKVRSYRLPTDEADAHEVILTQAAKHLGTFERPYWQFATYTVALALVLQDESMRGFAHRSAA